MPNENTTYKPLRISCNLPIDIRQAKKDLAKRYQKVREPGTVPESQALPDCNDPAALAQFLFGK